MYSRFIKNNQMDFIAEQVLSKAGISTAWQGKITKINIDSLIEFEYDLEIVWENIDHFSKDGIVLAAIFPKRKIIYMNDSKKDLFSQKMGTMNFSKAHELGHWILHVTKQQNYEQLTFFDNEVFFCRGGTKRPPEEIQADMFAASILMPKEIFTGAINLLKASGNVGFPDLYKLKDEFEVSISALTTRARELGLLYINNNKIFMSEAEAKGQLQLL
jgi:Zn-dependent peptidase ImmA (M78 family)